jgi:hypothetical protein
VLLSPRLGKPGTWNRPQNPTRAESSPHVGELSLPAQNHIWLHRFCILAHVNPLGETREFSTAPPHAALLFHASSSRSSLFRAMVGRLSRAAAGEPYHARKVRQLLILLPPSISSTTSSTPHSFFSARVCQAAAIAVAAAADPRFGSSR